jgi:integrase
MLYRVVRPSIRMGSRNGQFVKRIPADLRGRVVGARFEIPIGEGFKVVTLSAKAQSIRCSLDTGDPVEVKARNAIAAAAVERTFAALRNEDKPLTLTNRQAAALAGRLYRAWASGEGRERAVTVEEIPKEERVPGGPRMRRIEHDPLDDEDAFNAALLRLVRPGFTGKVLDLDHLPPAEVKPEPHDLERTLWPLVERLLRREAIGRVTPASRGLLLVAFWEALRDALESRLRNARRDYSPDPNAERFPEWESPLPPATVSVVSGEATLTSLVEGWWREAKAAGLKKSTHESYSGTVRAFIAFLGHDDAGRVTEDDVIGFKDHRLAMPNPNKKGETISAVTVQGNDLAGLKAVFGWGKANRRIRTNPAENVTIKLPRRKKQRGAKIFTDEEAAAILKATLEVERRQMRPETYAAKRWVPWLMAYSGARVGEVAQLRKQDLHQSKGGHWYIIITPEAGTVKTDEERVVVIHSHIIEQGFASSNASRSMPRPISSKASSNRRAI